MRVAFWGTPEFATPSLRALLGEGHDVVAVVTQPDRPIGRHRSTVTESPVKLVAGEEGIPVLQPESARSRELAGELTSLAPDISVVVAFGQLLPREIIDLPPQGTINIHASLLPRWRGAAPIQGAIRAGDTVSGVTVMQMVPRLDAGPIVLQNSIPILPDETYGELQLRLSELGALSLIEALVLISLGRAERIEQEETGATYAPRIERESARIDWTSGPAEVARQIRAYDPKPGAFTVRKGVELRCFGVRPSEARTGDAGRVLEIDESGMLVGCGAGSVRITYVHPAGRKRMAALDWAQGRGVEVGDIFGTSA